MMMQNSYLPPPQHLHTADIWYNVILRRICILLLTVYSLGLCCCEHVGIQVVRQCREQVTYRLFKVYVNWLCLVVCRFPEISQKYNSVKYKTILHKCLRDTE